MRPVEWQFQCDDNHLWVRAETESGLEPDSGACPVDGSEPVTARRLPWASEVAFRLVPATQVVDGVTGRAAGDDEYFVDVLGAGGEVLASSGQRYPLEAATQRVRALTGRTAFEVVGRARRMGFEVLADEESADVRSGSWPAVHSREDLAGFLARLSSRVDTDDVDLQHDTIAQYVEAMSGFVMDLPGVMRHSGGTVSEQPTWALVAMIVEAALSYE